MEIRQLSHKSDLSLSTLEDQIYKIEGSIYQEQFSRLDESKELIRTNIQSVYTSKTLWLFVRIVSLLELLRLLPVTQAYTCEAIIRAFTLIESELKDKEREHLKFLINKKALTYDTDKVTLEDLNQYILSYNEQVSDKIIP